MKKELREELKNITKGTWIFSCSMKPLQFGEWYDDQYDEFETIGGSQHSRRNCSLSIISEEYAKWFLANKIDELYVECGEDTWTIYEDKIRELAKRDGINYEGY
jgi:hypothetical protein